MAMFERSVLGLDVGSHSLKAVELKVSPRGLAAGQFRVHPRLEADSPLAEHIQRFLGMHHLPTNQVACALPASQLSTRRLEFPFSDRRRLSQAIPFEVEAETPFRLDQIFIDWNLLGSDRNHASVAATLAKRIHIGEFLAQFEEAGCTPHVLEAEGFVLANLAPIFGLEGTHLITDIGHQKTTFCALKDGHPILARSIPVAGRAMTEAVAAETGLSFAEAEQRKCERTVLGRGGPDDSAGVSAIIDRIAREALRTLEAAESRQDEGSLVHQATITLVGGGAHLERIEEALAKRTGLTTQRLRMPADASHADLVEGIDPVLFAPALALALRLSGEPATQFNFRQGEYAFRQDLMQLFNRELRPTAALLGVFLLLIIINTITTISLEYRHAASYDAAAASLYAEAFPDRPTPTDPVGALGSELRGAQARADFLGLYSGDRSALELLGELSRAIPADLAVRITEVNIDRNLIRLDVEAEGYEAADRLTSVLSQTDPFHGAKVTGSVKTDQRTGGVSFNVSIPLVVDGREA